MVLGLGAEMCGCIPHGNPADEDEEAAAAPAAAAEDEDEDEEDEEDGFLNETGARPLTETPAPAGGGGPEQPAGRRDSRR
jgi:hypothetical protein